MKTTRKSTDVRSVLYTPALNSCEGIQRICGPLVLETIFMRFEKLCDTRSLDRCILFKFIYLYLSCMLRPILRLFTHFSLHKLYIYVVVQFYPCFKLYFPWIWGMVMYD